MGLQRLQNIINGIVGSAFSLVINRQIIDHIIPCTELEAFREKFNNFLAVLYARGAYEAKNLKLSYLWSKQCTVVCNAKFLEINLQVRIG